MSHVVFPAVFESYGRGPNIKVVDNARYMFDETLICASSNGIYFPDTPENARAALEADRFEWQNLAPSAFRQIVLIRNPLKQWYWKGTCEAIPSIDDVVKCIQSRLCTSVMLA